MAKKSVVVLGAGFGGLRATLDIAKELRRLNLLESYEVILVDRNDCHLFMPLLYKVAASPDPKHEGNCTYEISSLVKNLPVRFVNDEIASMDLMSGSVQLKQAGAIHADYLIIALGSETNYFGIAGLKENALQLKSVESAMQIREAVTKAFEKGGDVKVVAGGGGPNGIELAAEIRAWANRAEKANPSLHVAISIVEAMPGILNGLDTSVAAIAMRRLKKLRIDVKTNQKIVSVTPTEIAIDGGTTIPFDVFVWTGGIKTPDMLTQLPIQKDPRGRPMAKNDMACVAGSPDLKLAPMVYGLGDSVCFINEKTGKPVPAVARVAITQGSVAARNVIDEIKHAEFSSSNIMPSTFHPMNYPYVIPIGERWAVAKLGPFIFSGWLGWAFTRAIELNYLRTIMPLGEAWQAWCKM